MALPRRWQLSAQSNAGRCARMLLETLAVPEARLGLGYISRSALLNLRDAPEQPGA